MENGFLAGLFDMSFSEFMTIRLIKVLYIIGIIGALFAGLLFIVGGFSDGAGTGIVFLLLSPILVGIYILMVRVWLELIIVLFRIAENTSLLVKIKKEGVVATGEE